MASEKTAPDDGPAPDPLDAELVAYLDGELDEAAARQLEARLGRDPAARARAAELKKSFDLLDYLPKPEPSPTFTTRTLERLPAVRPGDSSTPQPAAAPAGAPAKGTGSGPVSTSVPVPLEPERKSASASRPRLQLPAGTGGRESRSFLWAGGLVAAVLAFAAFGYLATAAVRGYLFPARDKEADAARTDPDPRVIERLPLYAAADDIGFVAELAKPEFFGDDPSVAFDPTLKIPAADVSEKPTGQQLDALAKAFRALPAARQAEVVKLDQDLAAREPRERDRLFRALEAYAAWLARLPEAERRTVLAAPTAAARLAAVRAARDRQWLEALPPALRAKLDALVTAKDRAELIQQWREEEATRRDRWAFIRQHVEAFAANKSPWPFDTERGRNEVIDFARHVFKVDDKRRCRLSLADLAEYNRTLAAARAEDSWAWYGLMVYELSRVHPYLPESDNPKLMIAELGELPEPYLSRANVKKGGFGPRGRLLALAGKWPEFPLEVLREVQFPPFGKGAFAPPLGPSRPGEFKPPVQDFAKKELFPKMAPEERRELDRLQGKWPDYPQRFMHFASKYDLAVPGVSLPGPPKKWEATYGLRSVPRPGGGK